MTLAGGADTLVTTLWRRHMRDYQGQSKQTSSHGQEAVIERDLSPVDALRRASDSRRGQADDIRRHASVGDREGPSGNGSAATDDQRSEPDRRPEADGSHLARHAELDDARTSPRPLADDVRASLDEPSTDEALAGEPSTDETPAEESSTAAPAEESSAEAPVEESSTEALAEESSTKAPSEEPSTEESQVDEPSIETSPDEEAPDEEASDSDGAATESRGAVSDDTGSEVVGEPDVAGVGESGVVSTSDGSGDSPPDGLAPAANGLIASAPASVAGARLAVPGEAPLVRTPDLEALLPVVDGEPAHTRESRLEQARGLVEADRHFAEGAMGDMMQSLGPVVDAIASDGAMAAERLDAGRGQADAAVEAALQTQLALVAAAVSSQRSRVTARAESARAAIEADRIARLVELTASVQGARTQVQTSFEAARQSVRARAEVQRAEVEALYVQAGADFAAAGRVAAGAAVSMGARRAATYRSRKIHRDDSVLDGPLTDNRCEARAEAAEKVAESYRQGLLDEALRIAEEARQTLADDLAAVDLMAERALSELDASESTQVQALDSLMARGAIELESVGARMLARVDSAQASHLERISTHAHSAQRVLVARRGTVGAALADQARAATQEIDEAIARLDSLLTDALAPLVGGEVELAPPEVLGPLLVEAEAQAISGLEGVGATLAEAVDAALAGLAQTGTGGEAALAEAGATSIGGLHGIGDAAVSGLAAIEDATGAAFAESIARTHQGASDIVEATHQAIAATEERMRAAFESLSRGLQQGFANNVAAVQGGMMDAVRDRMPGIVSDEAREAAAQVQPRWKSIVKWVIIIAIAVVVAVVLGPMIVGAVSGLAAGLGASATAAGIWGAVAGGAIAGALAGGATTIVSNLFDGRDWHAGVLQSMAIGALGGAIGGGVGLGLGKMTGQLSNLSQFGVAVGSDMVLDLGMSAVMGDLSWESFGTSLLLSVITNGASSTPLGQSIQTRMTGVGYGAGYRTGQNLHGVLGGSGYDGPAPTVASQHINEGDNKGNSTDWNMKGGGHNPDIMSQRAQDAGYSEQTLATDPLTGATIKEYSRPKVDSQGNPRVDANGDPQIKLERKSQFPPGMSAGDVDALVSQALTDALGNKPHSSHTSPAGSASGHFQSLVTSPDGHPMPVSGYYSVDANGVPHVKTAYPVSDIQNVKMPTSHVPGSYGTKPLYATQPHATMTGDDQETR